ncbi:MAG: hypothetical protein Q8O94_03625 [bacterium]|nr:hypothetical protein [bacterium]
MSIKILEYKEVNKGALVGSLSVYVEKMKLEIRNITVFNKGGKRWIAMPSRAFEADGKQCYYAFIKFPDRAISDAFQAQVLAALDEYLAVSPPLPTECDDSGPCPF